MSTQEHEVRAWIGGTLDREDEDALTAAILAWESRHGGEWADDPVTTDDEGAGRDWQAVMLDRDLGTEQALRVIGTEWTLARIAERDAAARAYWQIRVAADAGIPETRISDVVGVDRMTVRRALGKR